MSKIKNDANNFWNKYSKKNLSLNSLMNLETNEEESKNKFEIEKKKISNVVPLSSSKVLVDLGGGVGLWSQYFSSRTKKVILVENQKEFCDIARRNLKEDNITIIQSDVVDYDMEEDNCDYVFISGVTIYLDDTSFEQMMKKVIKYLKKGGLFIHRDAYGTKDRFLLSQKYSAKLESEYSAVYRTRDEYDNIMCEIFGFKKIYDEDMYKMDKKLNKWSETRLRLAVYKNDK